MANSGLRSVLWTASEAQAAIPIVLFATFSLVATVLLAARISFLAVRTALTGVGAAARELVFFRTQLGMYVACLVMGNFFSCVSGIMEAAHIRHKGIEDGSFCTSQAVLNALGDFSAAYFTTVIAIHTFSSLVMRYRSPLWLARAVIAGGWLTSILLSVLPAHLTTGGGRIYGDNTVSCGIMRAYPLQEFLMHLLPIFVTATVSTVLFALIVLVVRGMLVIRGGLGFAVNPESLREQRDAAFDEYHQFLQTISMSMIWYPLAYMILMLPQSFSLLLNISGFSVAWSTKVFCTVCSLMCGITNVCLIYNTIRVLKPAFAQPAASSAETPRSSEGSDAGPEKFAFSLQIVSADPLKPAHTFSHAVPAMAYDYPQGLTPGAANSLSRSSSAASSASARRLEAAELQRAITPASELEQMFEVKDSTSSNGHDAGSLPPPPRARGRAVAAPPKPLTLKKKVVAAEKKVVAAAQAAARTSAFFAMRPTSAFGVPAAGRSAAARARLSLFGAGQRQSVGSASEGEAMPPMTPHTPPTPRTPLTPMTPGAARSPRSPTTPVWTSRPVRASVRVSAFGGRAWGTGGPGMSPATSAVGKTPLSKGSLTFF